MGYALGTVILPGLGSATGAVVGGFLGAFLGSQMAVIIYQRLESRIHLANNSLDFTNNNV